MEISGQMGKLRGCVPLACGCVERLWQIIDVRHSHSRQSGLRWIRTYLPSYICSCTRQYLLSIYYVPMDILVGEINESISELFSFPSGNGYSGEEPLPVPVLGRGQG